MPNYVENRIIMEGIEVLPLYEKWGFDFNKLIPMPESLNVTAGSTNDEDIYIYLSEMFTKDIVNDPLAKKLITNMFDENFVLHTGERCKKLGLVDTILAQRYRSGKQLVENYQKYGYTTWYDWCSANWGTKWKAYQTSIGDGSVTFLTASDAPKPIFKELSKRYPDKLIRVKARYDEGYTLRADYQGGECIKAYSAAAERFFFGTSANVSEG